MFEELIECSKEYLIKQLEYSYKEIERLTKRLEEAQLGFLAVSERIDKAIETLEEYIKEGHIGGLPSYLLEILKSKK